MSRLVGRLGLVVLLGIAILVCPGCGKQKRKDRPETVPVTGVVTYKGQPVDGARLAFMADSQEVQGGVALAGPDGKFSAMTFEPGDGLMPGSFTVTVVKMVGGELTEASDAPPTPVKNVLPDKYSRRETSPLKVEVKKGEANNFTLDLQD